MLGKLSRFRSAVGGAAAVEFAIAVPLLSAFLGAIIQYGGMLIAYDQMHDAVSSGAVYVMRGGTDATAIHGVAIGAWANKPSDASVVVNQQCFCQGVGAACSAPCADQSYPQSFTSIAASGTYTGLWSTQLMSSSQVVRTQ